MSTALCFFLFLLAMAACLALGYSSLWALLLGLVLRKPVIRLNNWVSRNLESTKVM